MNRLSGGPAFPSPGVLMDDGRGGEYQEGAYEGMTLRDYFAAKAMQALLSKPIHRVSDGQAIPSAAYSIADAMISERAK